MHRQFRRPSVYLSNGIGDQLVSLPAVRAIASLFHSGLQLFLREGLLSFPYRGLPVGEPVRVWWADPDVGDIDFARTLAPAGPCDLFVSFATRVSPSMATFPRVMGARHSIGFSERFDHALPVVRDRHMYDQTFALAHLLEPSLQFDAFAGPPTFSPAAEAAASHLATAHRRPGGRLLFVHPETRPEKMWDHSRLGWVLDQFLRQHPDFTVLISETAPAEGWTDRPGVVRIDVHLELAMALMRHVDLFLGIDSCFLHAADLFRVPGVALFGPTRPEQWGFRLSPRYRHVSAVSMADIRPEPVLSALLELATP